MDRRTVLATGGASLLLAACVSGGTTGAVQGPKVYKITPKLTQEIPFRLLDSVNSLRAAKGAQPLTFNAALNAACLTHSLVMSVQNRPWHFGSDGSSLLVRVQLVNYQGKLLGELISETYQTELETLSAWMAEASTRDVLLDARANQLGFAWFQEPSGKIWWTLLTGG